MGVGFNEPFSMFDSMSAIFPIFFIVFIAIFLFVIIKNIMQWNYCGRAKFMAQIIKIFVKTALCGSALLCCSV
ncbi:hypothetical protein M5X17_31840, partial [Paenibacillus alvei]|nr:hypothetical protein [Paenibacillus alvei]